jgi:hypothetical protein
LVSGKAAPPSGKPQHASALRIQPSSIPCFSSRPDLDDDVTWPDDLAKDLGCAARELSIANDATPNFL